MKQLLVLLSTGTLLLASCATILTGSKDRISFSSTPAGATVYKDGIELCKTPCSVDVRRNLGNTNIQYKLDGYETRIITLDKSLNVISILNLGNLVGWGIDALTGAVMKYDTKSYDITLSKNNRTAKILPSKVNIDTRKKAVDVYVLQGATK